MTRGNVGQLSPATEGGGLLNPYELPATHDHNLNLYLASYGSTDERERRALHHTTPTPTPTPTPAPTPTPTPTPITCSTIFCSPERRS